MSIILKGIDMPKDIDELRLIINGMSIAIEPTQAIQIPTSHGRLIDETEVKKNSIDDGYDLYVSWTEIDNAQTILEAEE